MRRRAFLERAALLAIGVATGSSAAAVPVEAGIARIRLTEEKAVLLADRLLHAYPLKRSLVVIGGAYWQEAASKDSGCGHCLPDVMTGFLLHLDVAEATFRDMPAAALRDHVRSGNAADFERGRIVPVRGWLLGETEARLCAIAALRAA